MAMVTDRFEHTRRESFDDIGVNRALPRQSSGEAERFGLELLRVGIEVAMQEVDGTFSLREQAAMVSAVQDSAVTTVTSAV
jgi:hypothetical protein